MTTTTATRGTTATGGTAATRGIGTDGAVGSQTEGSALGTVEPVLEEATPGSMAFSESLPAARAIPSGAAFGLLGLLRLRFRPISGSIGDLRDSD